MNYKLDLIYVFNYDDPYLNEALIRFRCSLLSIKDQNVRICISNNSSKCIKHFLDDFLQEYTYIHKPIINLFSRAQALNFAIKNMAESEYFIISDVDLVYSPDHIQRLMLKFYQLNTSGEKMRYITYNYNLLPDVQKPGWANLVSRIPIFRNFIKNEIFLVSHLMSHDYTVLDQLSRTQGGYAHGNGLVHLETFLELKGYDEELVGYGPEDGLFNLRISKINRIVYDNLPDTASFHQWHPPFHYTQVEKNFSFWREKSKYFNSRRDFSISELRANVNKTNWGVFQ